MGNRKERRKMAQISTCKKLDTSGTRRLTPQRITERLEDSMSRSPIRTDKEAAREFLSRLSMYDENGQLKREY